MPDSNLKHIVLCVTNDITYDQRMNKTANSLCKLGYKVTIIGRKHKNSRNLHENKYHQRRLKCWINSGPLFYLEYNIRLFIFLLNKKFDIITACDLDTILGVYYIGKLKKAHLVFDAHEYFSEVPELKDRPLKILLWNSLEKIYVPKMNKCYTVNQSLADIFDRRLGTSFNVVENLPISINLNHSIKPIDNHILIYQGVLNEGRGLIELVRMMIHFPKFKLWIVGEGVMKSTIEELISSLNLQDQVELKGYILPMDLPIITARATIGINLLRADCLNYYYSSANKCFDYIQAGLPSINMNFPEYKRINDRYKVSILLDQLTDEQLFNAVEQISQEHIYRELAKNCDEAKSDLNWNKNQLILESIYDFN